MGLVILPAIADTDAIPIYRNVPSEDEMSVSSDDESRPPKRMRLEGSRTIVVPGESITSETVWMHGHGAAILSPTSTLITATLAGPIVTTNKLIRVDPVRARYAPEVGDLVVGRIVSVDKNQWRVDIAAPLLAKLSMSSINLPGGALRRRTAIDELQMRKYFQEGDLIVAEVQQAPGGYATLHARSLKYGKLRNGVFLAIAGTGGGGVVRSRRQQFTVGKIGEGEVDVILGVNGYVWLSKHIDEEKKAGGVDVSISNLDEQVGWDAYSSQNDMIDEGTRREMSRLSEVIKCLADAALRVDEENVRRGYDVAGELILAEGIDSSAGGREMLDSEFRRRVLEGVMVG